MIKPSTLTSTPSVGRAYQRFSAACNDFSFSSPIPENLADKKINPQISKSVVYCINISLITRRKIHRKIITYFHQLFINLLDQFL